MSWTLAVKRSNVSACWDRGPFLNTRGSGSLLRSVESPAGTGRQLNGIFRPRFFGVQLDPQLDQPVNQLRIGQPRRFPQLRIHADGGKTRNRVQFVHVDLARGL